MKRVIINEEYNKEYTTYTNKEYDRCTIDSILYQKCYQRVSSEEWINIFIILNNYKCTEMEIHKDSINNISLINIETFRKNLIS